MRRRKARELALKMLYQVEVNRDAADAALGRYVKVFPYEDDIVSYTRFLLSGVTRELDKPRPFHRRGLGTLEDQQDHLCRQEYPEGGHFRDALLGRGAP